MDLNSKTPNMPNIPLDGLQLFSVVGFRSLRDSGSLASLGFRATPARKRPSTLAAQ